MNEKRAVRFVSALLNGQRAHQLENGQYRANKNGKPVSLDATQVSRLVSDGVLELGDMCCNASSLARNWVKRQLLSQDGFVNQHRELILCDNGAGRNLLEGPMLKLSVGRKGAPSFMAGHHIQAAQKIQYLSDKAHMTQRTTMSYDPTRSSSKSSLGSTPLPLSDRTIDARRELNACLQDLPKDCAGVVLDVCGLQKGLQLVELERKWPR